MRKPQTSKRSSLTCVCTGHIPPVLCSEKEKLSKSLNAALLQLRACQDHSCEQESALAHQKDSSQVRLFETLTCVPAIQSDECKN